MMFERETGRRFRADERPLVAEFRSTDLAIIEEAIRHAVRYAREPVGSFAYCAKVIRQRCSTRPSEPPATSPLAAQVPAPAEASLYEVRTIAARLFERHRNDPGFGPERLRELVADALAAHGRVPDAKLVEEATRGMG